MKTVRLALIPLLVLLFAGGWLAGCNKAPEESKNENTPEMQKMRQEKKGD